MHDLVPSSWMAALASIPEVTAVDTYRDVRVMVNGQRVAIVSRDLRLHARISRYLMRQGDSSEQLNRAADIGGVLVSEILAGKLGVHEGDSLEIVTPEGAKRFEIVAVFYEYATDGGKILMDRALYQSLWHDELVTVYPVYLAAGVDLDRVRTTMAARLQDVGGGRFPPLLISNAELRTDPNYQGEVAERRRYKDGSSEIGVIASVTQAFCRDCNRARLSAEGKLYTCLFSIKGHDLRDLMRSGATDEEISQTITKIWGGRSDRYSRTPLREHDRPAQG